MASDSEAGWRVSRPGSSREEVGVEVGQLLRTIERACAAQFRARDGYVRLLEPLAGDVDGGRVVIVRGEFRAEVDVRGTVPAGCEGPSILLRARTRIARLDAHGRAWPRRGATLRLAGGAAGLGLVAGVFGPVVVAAEPNALALMLGCVMLGMLPMLGALLGGYAADRLGADAFARLSARSAADPGLCRDFRRWAGLCRRLAQERRALARSSRGGPFRREALVAPQPGPSFALPSSS
jgi:hypothetical protein